MPLCAALLLPLGYWGLPLGAPQMYLTPTAAIGHVHGELLHVQPVSNYSHIVAPGILQVYPCTCWDPFACIRFPLGRNFRALLLHPRVFYPLPCRCSHSGPPLSHCFVSGPHCLQWPAPCPSHCVVSGPPLLLQWPVLCPPHPTALSVAPTAVQWPICSSHCSAVAHWNREAPLE